MPIVQSAATDAGSNALANIAVRITLMTGTPGVPGYLADADIISATSVTTAQDGAWSATLTGNSEITPANTYYQVLEGNAVSNIVVPASGGPYSLIELLVTPPTPAAAGIGPMVDIPQMDTESAAPTARDDGNGGMQCLLGRIKFTGLYTAASISIPTTGLEVIDGQQKPGPVTAAALPTGTTPVQNPHWRWATVTLAGGTVTAVKQGAYMGGSSAPAMTSVYTQSAGALPLSSWRVPPGGWIEVDCTVAPTTNSWVLD
ncbi:MAG TPA: hypothetical protein VGG83_10800 [Trebonia sp.]